MCGAREGLKREGEGGESFYVYGASLQLHAKVLARALALSTMFAIRRPECDTYLDRCPGHIWVGHINVDHKDVK
eukprot:6648778-Prymnesium_polylepis.1